MTEHRDVGDREEAIAKLGLDTLHDRSLFREGWEAARRTRFVEIDILNAEWIAERYRMTNSHAEWMAKCEALRKDRDHYQMAAEAEAKFADEFREKVEALSKDIDRYQSLCAAVYQMAGTVNAPGRFLDALSDAANGELEARAPTESLLPVDTTESGCFPPWSAAEAINAERKRTIEECANFLDENAGKLAGGLTEIGRTALLATSMQIREMAKKEVT